MRRFEKRQRETENTRVKEKKKKSMVSVRFLICRFFHMAPALSALFKCDITLQQPLLSMHICPPLQPSRFLFSSSLHSSSSLMTELLAGDMKAAFSGLTSTLNSREEDRLSKMLNWTLDFFLTHSDYLFTLFLPFFQSLSLHLILPRFISASIYCS